MKKVISVLLTTAAILSLVPIQALASSANLNIENMGSRDEDMDIIPDLHFEIMNFRLEASGDEVDVDSLVFNQIGTIPYTDIESVSLMHGTGHFLTHNADGNEHTFTNSFTVETGPYDYRGLTLSVKLKENASPGDTIQFEMTRNDIDANGANLTGDIPLRSQEFTIIDEDDITYDDEVTYYPQDEDELDGLTRITSVYWGDTDNPVATIHYEDLTDDQYLWYQITKDAGGGIASATEITTTPETLNYGDIIQKEKSYFGSWAGSAYRLLIGVCDYDVDEASGIGGPPECHDKQSKYVYFEQDPDTDSYNPPNSEISFPDVPKSHPNYQAIEFLKSFNIINGYEDGYYRPDWVVSRIEILKIALNAASVPVYYDPAFSFPDVPADSWYAPYVSTAYRLGYVSGFDGKFWPNQQVNRVEALKILFNINGVIVPSVSVAPYDDVPVSEWYASFVTVAKVYNYMDVTGNMFYPGQGMNRGDVSEVMYRVLTY